MTLDTIILAAGIGKRMHSKLPKVLHTIGGIPMLEHVIMSAQSLNPQTIYVIHGNGGDTVKQTLEHLPVSWIEQKKQLGTAHAVSQAIEHINDNSQVLILYGDVPLIQPELLQELFDATADNGIGLITTILDNPSGFGRILRDNSGNISAIIEHKDASPEQQAIKEINTGIMCCSSKLLKQFLPQISNQNAQGEYYLTDIIALAVKNRLPVNRILANHPQEVLGANNRTQIAELERYYQYQAAQNLMAKGAKLLDPHRFDLRGKLEVGIDVTIDINVIIEGKVTFGNNTIIGPNTIIKNSTIGNNVQILANTIIEDAIVEDNSNIGPFARLRPGTHIENSAHVGNFVELKKTRLGANSKANHLSYLGDSTIGKEVNIGAGTITCNYDGVNKHPTTIGDHAFVGSNCQLVAPVTIGKNATIGAGSTITKNAPADKLTLSRSRQTTIENWQRPKKNS